MSLVMFSQMRFNYNILVHRKNHITVATKQVFWTQNIIEKTLRSGLLTRPHRQRSPDSPAGFGSRFVAGRVGKRDWIEQGLTSHSIHFRSFWRRARGEIGKRGMQWKEEERERERDAEKEGYDKA